MGKGRVQRRESPDLTAGSSSRCATSHSSPANRKIAQKQPLQHNFVPSPRSNDCARKRGPGLELQMATRRAFMKGGAMALVGTSVVPTFLQRSVLAQTTSAQPRARSW